MTTVMYGVARDAVKDGSTAEENGVVRGVVSADLTNLRLSEG